MNGEGDLFAALYEQHALRSPLTKKWAYYRKKWAWQSGASGAKVAKRVLDVLLATTFLLLFFPLMVCIACLIKLQDGGPVFYVSRRVGKWGTTFWFPKFRTMRPESHQIWQEILDQNLIEGDVKFKLKRDPRSTQLGRILRKTSLDELPQLWCVLKGEMSLVGPRPPLIEEVSLYTADQRRRLDAQPGLTCFWQVNGRSEIPFDRQVHLDLDYIRRQSIWLDVKLICQTIPAVLLGRGAY